jgi:hypothetical protein
MPHDFVDLATKFRYFDDLFPAIITLNWDSLFEFLVSTSHYASEIVMGWESSSGERPLLHLHGCMSWFLASERLNGGVGQYLLPYLYTIREPDRRKKGPVLYGLLDPFLREIDLESDELWELRSLLLTVAESCIAIPSHRKSLSELRLDHLWASAALLLEGADNLIVIGYSLPDDDDHMRVLLRQALRKRNVKGQRTRILLVDPNANLLASRYRQLAGDAEIVPIEKTFARLTRSELELNLLESSRE